MKTFFSRITADHWCAKNTLEKAAHELAKEMDRRIVSESEVAAFKKEFQDKVDALNLEHKRCKPLRFSIQASLHPKGDFVIYCDGVFYMSLFLAKGETIHTIVSTNGVHAVPAYSVEPGNAVSDDAPCPGNIVYISNGMENAPGNILMRPLLSNPDNRYYVYAGAPPTCMKSNDCPGIFDERCPDNVTCPIHKIYKMNFSTLNKF